MGLGRTISWRTCQVINYHRCTADSQFWFWFSDIGFWFSILVFGSPRILGSPFRFLVLHFGFWFSNIGFWFSIFWFLVLHFFWFSILVFGSPFWFLVLHFGFGSPFGFWFSSHFGFWFSILVLQFVVFLVLHFGFWFLLQIGTVQAFNMRPYLDLLHHFLVMEHSWQTHQIKMCFVGECMHGASTHYNMMYM